MKASQILLASAIVVVCSRTMQAQQIEPQQRQAVRALRLGELTQHAGAIFYGRVLKVEAPPVVVPVALHEQGRTTPKPAPAPIVKITFRVLTGFRGVETGQEFVVREWAPLWLRQSRYRAGDTIVLFAYPVSPAGMSSPVGGPRGVITIKAGEVKGRKGVSYSGLRAQIERLLR